MLDSLSPIAWHIARQPRPSSVTGQPLGVPTAPHSHLMWPAYMDPGHCDCNSLGQGLCADLPTCPLHALYEGDPQWRMLEPESQDPAQGAASHRVQPPLGLPPLLSHPQVPSVPHQASQLPCRIPRTRWASFQYFCLEPWGQLQVAKAQEGLPFPVNVGSLAIERQPRYMFTEPVGGSEAMTCLENLGSPLWELKSAASPFGLFPSPVPCPNDQGPDSPGM